MIKIVILCAIVFIMIGMVLFFKGRLGALSYFIFGIVFVIIGTGLISVCNNDITAFAYEKSNSSTTYKLDVFEQQVSYDRENKDYQIKCTYSTDEDTEKKTIDSVNPDTEIIVQGKEPTEVVVTEIEYFSFMTFKTNTLYSYYFM